jgi:hypothetical protein
MNGRNSLIAGEKTQEKERKTGKWGVFLSLYNPPEP